MRGSLKDSNAKALRGAFIIVLAAAAMGVSAAAGAWVQAHKDKPLVLSPEQEQLITQTVERDSAYVRDNVQLLAEKVGRLQARLIAMEGLSKRVASAAGLSYTDPEIHAAIDGDAGVIDDIAAGVGAADWSAESVGRHLDYLAAQLVVQQDKLALLDGVLTKRAGVEAQMPTLQPVDYPYLSSSFGWRRHPVTGRHSMHEGLDFAAPKGSPIHAASGGVVTEARYVPGYGKMVEISHGNGLLTRYAHASSLAVKMGDVVEKGQMIARVGSTGRSTGPHLHFEVRMAGHPLDPTLFIEGGDPSVADEDATLVADAASAAEAAQVR